MNKLIKKIKQLERQMTIAKISGTHFEEMELGQKIYRLKILMAIMK